MRDARSQLIELGEALAEEKNVAYELWTWLPSHAVAQKHHGDYASTFTPSVKDVLVEAALYFGQLKYMSTPDSTIKEWFERCTCGEEHL